MMDDFGLGDDFDSVATAKTEAATMGAKMADRIKELEGTVAKLARENAKLVDDLRSAAKTRERLELAVKDAIKEPRKWEIRVAPSRRVSVDGRSAKKYTLEHPSGWRHVYAVEVDANGDRTTYERVIEGLKAATSAREAVGYSLVIPLKKGETFEIFELVRRLP